MAHRIGIVGSHAFSESKMKRIQEKNWVYSLAQYYVNASFLMAYRRCEYIGTEKIPNDGAIILAPNHTNCLQDALAVLALNHTPKVNK